jgi:ribose transport system substrate-binding protein
MTTRQWPPAPGQRPFEMGEKAMDVLLAIKKGQKVPETVYTSLDLVPSDNVVQPLLPLSL